MGSDCDLSLVITTRLGSVPGRSGLPWGGWLSRRDTAQPGYATCRSAVHLCHVCYSNLRLPHRARWTPRRPGCPWAYPAYTLVISTRIYGYHPDILSPRSRHLKAKHTLSKPSVLLALQRAVRHGSLDYCLFPEYISSPRNLRLLCSPWVKHVPTPSCLGHGCLGFSSSFSGMEH